MLPAENGEKKSCGGAGGRGGEGGVGLEKGSCCVGRWYQRADGWFIHMAVYTYIHLKYT